jgi:hypothetical protein
MTVSLGITGRSVEISVDEYLRMSDEDFQYMIAHEQGFVLNHPFMNTCLLDLCGQKEEPESEEEETDESLFDPAEIEEMVSNDSFGDI